ncbi:MAG: aminoglycoside phosphotransferase family protein [Bacteroidia bacterium]|nr:aminoglycoside phosphotransferase family protein [Bacteroidia bacterium]
MNNDHSNTDLLIIVGHFHLPGKILNIRETGEGHINDTFLVETDAGQSFILQRINHRIFCNVHGLMDNIDRVCSHINLFAKLHPEGQQLIAPQIVAESSGALFHSDENGNFWRCMTYIHHQPPKEIDVNIALEGGKAIGRFQKILSTLPGERLHETIPNFHNLNLRLEALHEAIQKDVAGRLGEVLHLTDAIQKREEEMLQLHRLESEGKIPVRVVHNDTKLNNVLFDNQGKAIALIDMDTVMNGSVLYDFGDAIRTLCNTTYEDESRLALVRFRFDLFEAFAAGYLLETKEILEPIEIEYLAFSCKLLTYIMAVRFLTDYLNGDVYFKTRSPMHNMHRASNQLRLLEGIEHDYPAMQQAIGRLANR